MSDLRQQAVDGYNATANSLRDRHNKIKDESRDTFNSVRATEVALTTKEQLEAAGINPDMVKYVKAQTISSVAMNNPELLEGTKSLTVDPEPLTITIDDAYMVEDNAPNKSNVLQNKLNAYNSFNYIITMACLTNDELNRPDQTLKRRNPEHVLLATGGGRTPKPLTAFELGGRRIEYFIDNLDLSSIISPNPKSSTTTATNLTFDIIEPYSMGLLIQSLQLIALQAGHQNYLEAPFAFVIEFLGYDQDGNAFKIPETRRIITFKLVGAEFGVTEAGAQYAMKGVPYNQSALSNTTQMLLTDLTVTGRTVQEVLQQGLKSLTAGINGHNLIYQTKNKGASSEPDDYIIIFPTDRSSESFWEAVEGLGEDTGVIDKTDFVSSRDFTQEELQSLRDQVINGLDSMTEAQAQAATDTIKNNLGAYLKRSKLSEDIKNKFSVQVNDIGKSEIKIDPLDTGPVPFGLEAFAIDKEQGILKKGSIKIDTKKRLIQFKKGTKIQDIIEEVILLSDYARKSLNAKRYGGNIKWWTIETMALNLTNPEHEKKTGKPPRLYVYMVIPYDVHESVMSLPNEAFSGYDDLNSQVNKEYNYTYTGKNIDVLSFDIQYKIAFFSSVPSDSGNDRQSADPTGGGKRQDEEIQEQSGGNTQFTGQGGTPKQMPTNSAGKPLAPGAVKERPEIAIARQFNEQVVNSDADMISGTLEIMGDPYYLPDSGMGNYISKPNARYINVAEDGTVDYQRGQVDLRVNFRTPIDIREGTGLYDFGDDVVSVGEFSGLYFLTKIQSTFNNGEFKNVLHITRRKNQNLADKATQAGIQNTKANEELNKKIADMRAAGANEEDIAFAALDKNGDGLLQGAELNNPPSGVTQDQIALAKGKVFGTNKKNKTDTGEGGE